MSQRVSDDPNAFVGGRRPQGVELNWAQCEGGRDRLEQIASGAGARRSWRPALAGLLLPLLTLTACAGSSQPSGRATALRLADVVRRKPQQADVSTLPGLPPHLTAVAFADDRHGWVGGAGVLLATADGGRTWREAYRGSGTVDGFSVLSARRAFAATSAGLLATSDGTTWRLVSPRPLDAVQFFSPQAGVALQKVGDLAPGGPNEASSAALRILRTADGGQSWQAVPGPPVMAACFFNPRQGAAARRTSGGIALAFTADGGLSWTSTTDVADAYWGSLTCTPDGGAWLVAGGGVGMSQASYTVLRSGDYGQRFAPVLARPTAGGGPAPGNPQGVAPGPGQGPGPLAAVDKDHAVVLGTCPACADGEGTVLVDRTADGGRTWRLLTSAVPRATSVDLAVSAPSMSRLWLISSPQSATGEWSGDLALLQTSGDGGRTWRSARLFAPTVPDVVRFETADEGYGVGWRDDPRAVLTTGDGGRTWRIVGHLPRGLAAAQSYDPLAAPGGGRLFLVAFDLPYDQHQALYASQDGGGAWRRVSLPSEGYGVSTVSFATSALGCVAVSTQGGMRDYATRDAGATWRSADMQGVPAALCAEQLTDPALAALAERLLARLAPPARSTKTDLPAYILTSADAGGDSLWIALFSSTTPTQRIYVLGPGGRSASIRIWPQSAPGLAGLSPVSDRVAYLWCGDGRLLRTTDGGARWLQVRATTAADDQGDRPRP